jgi:hypothetical protein
MPEWLRDSWNHTDVPLPLLAVRLGVALALGCVVAGTYRLTHGKGRAEGNGLTATLVLLTVLIGMVTLVIGNSVARAFSLVGALAIVRFRTVVEDTRDTAFVIFAVSVGMAVGAGFLTVALVGIPFAAAAAFLFRPRGAAAPEGALDFLLTLRVGAGHDAAALVREPFGKHLAGWRLVATATARQGAALDLTYAVRLREEGAAVALVTELNRLDGLQGAELRQG